LEKGRFVAARDDLAEAKVAVLGATVVQYLFQDQYPIGKRVLVSGVDFEVVGVLASKADGPGLGPGMSTDDRIFILLSALQKRVLGTSDLRLIAITARDSSQIPEVVQQAKALLDGRHPGNSFEIKTQLELLQTSESVSSVVTVLLTTLAAVSLFVGGIGNMNIMLDARGRNRTSAGNWNPARGRRSTEIHLGSVLDGVFDSEPCRWFDWRGLGITRSLVPGRIVGWNVSILPTGVVLVVSSSLFVGGASGICPAQTAAQLNLVDGLRFE
jgi:putative ABC transport system permease protein